MLLRSGAAPAGVAADAPIVLERCPAEVWDDDFELGAEWCLVVRPDQHVAYRGAVASLASCLERLVAGTPDGG